MLAIPNQYSSLEFIKPIGWPEIFETWRKGEAHQESWKKHWEERGFSSWEEWREAYAQPLTSEGLDWHLYKINKPLEEFPNIYGVPSDAWIKKAYNGEKTKILKDIINLPIVTENDKVTAIKKYFPKNTMFTGIIVDEKIVLIEGQHRALALTSWDKSVPLNSEIMIALTEWKEKEIPRIGGNYKK